MRPSYKILFIDHTPFVGGAQLALISLIKKINNSQIEPIVINSTRAEELGFAAEYRAAGIKYYLIPFLAWKKKCLGIFNLISDLCRVVKIVKAEKIELIFSNTVRTDILAAIVALITRRKVVWYLLDYTFPRRLFNFLKKIPARIFYVSWSVAEYYQGEAADTKDVFYLWSDLLEKPERRDDSEIISAKRLLALEAEDFLVIYLGRLVEHKGPQALVKAIAHLRKQNIPVKALLIGTGENQEGNNEKELKALTKEHGLEKVVIFLGPKSDIRPYLSLAKVLTLTTIGSEPFSSVVLEAMLAQVAVVATNTGGTAEINQPEKICLIVPPDDYLQLAESINRLRLDENLRQELVNKAYRQVSSRYALTPAALAWERIFLAIMNKE